MAVYPAASARDSYRAATEDRVSIRSCHGRLLVVLADGVGGLAGGAEAADLAIHRIQVYDPVPDPASLVTALMEADRRVYDQPSAGETTAVVVLVTPQGLFGASVGDSMAWLVTEGGFIDLTCRQHRTPTLGSAMAVPIPFVHREPGGTLLVASDGLFNFAPAEGILAAARGEDLDAAARALVELARSGEGTFMDDVAVALCRWAPESHA